MSEGESWRGCECHTAFQPAIQFLSSGSRQCHARGPACMVVQLWQGAVGRPATRQTPSWPWLLAVALSLALAGGGPTGCRQSRSLTRWLAGSRRPAVSVQIGLATIVNRLLLLQSNSPILKHPHLCRPARLRHRSTLSFKSNSQNTPKTKLGHRQYGKFAVSVELAGT